MHITGLLPVVASEVHIVSKFVLVPQHGLVRCADLL